ncbi:caspase activity and apoptosis inhibitor 1-like [Ptychodera flava]|uniref:caspase activity and apoptosis inhibitor 1-like n=1 Tax=Ptychodera flava TaxID=63121 RepID=UPI00396A27E8
MMPDSTQSEKTEEKKATKRKAEKKKEKATKKKKKVTHKKAKKSSSPNEAEAKAPLNSDNEYDSDLDLDKELKPIGAYIKNREEMLEHIFKTIKGDKLKAMLPDILKNCPLEEIKSLCLDQLEVMSKKRIRAVLAGQGLSSSSGTEESSSEEESAGQSKVKVRSEVIQEGQPEKQTKEGNVVELSKNEDDIVDDAGDKSSLSGSADHVKDGADGSGCHSDSIHGDSDVVDSTTDQQEVASVADVLTLSPQRDDENDSLFNDVIENDEKIVDADNPSSGSLENDTTPQPGQDSGQGESNQECSVPSDADQRQGNEQDGSIHRDSSNGDSIHGNPSDVASQEDGKSKPTEARVQTRLELLELEMRARAIRSLMQANERKEISLKASQAKLQ